MAVLEATLRVTTPEELAAAHYPNGRVGGLAVPGKPPGALGQRVKLTVEIAKPARKFVVDGQLAWARHKAAPNQPSGFGVDFLSDDDGTRARLLAFARKEVAWDAVRAFTRNKIELQVKLVHDGTQRREWVADLSEGGAFVRTWNPLPVGAPLQLFLRAPMALLALEVGAHVAWNRTVGDDPGMGLVFEDNEPLRLKLSKLVEKLVR